MGFLKKMMGFILILVILFFVGDYLNLPLWPTDLLKTSFPVEVHFVLETDESIKSQDLFKKSSFYEAFLCDDHGNKIQKLYVDPSGVSRCVVEQGHYTINSLVTVVLNNKFHLFSAGMENELTRIVVESPGQKIPVVLKRTTQLEAQSKKQIFKVYLQESDLESARVLSKELTPLDQEKISELIELRNTLIELPLEAYHSNITCLKRIHEILSEYAIPDSFQIIVKPDDTVHVVSRLNALERARNEIIESYVKMMNEFHNSGRLMSVLQEWNQFVSNLELSEEREYLPENLSNELDRFELIVQDLSALIPSEIETNFNRGVDLYDSGDLAEARKKFTKLLSFLNNMNLQESYEVVHGDTVEYLEDIEIISAANHAIRTDNLQKALFMFDLIAHPNALVRQRIAETKRFLQLKSGKDSY